MVNVMQINKTKLNLHYNAPDDDDDYNLVIIIVKIIGDDNRHLSQSPCPFWQIWFVQNFQSSGPK